MTATDLKRELETARKRLAELEAQTASTRDSDSSLETLIFENAPGGMAIVSLEGLFLVANRESTQIIGYEGADLSEINVEEVIVLDADRRHLQKSFAREKAVSGYEMQVRCKDDTIIWVSLNGKPIEYDGKKAALITFTDVTRHKQALNKLELDELRFEMLYTISGMFHQPESEILNFALNAIVKVTDSRIGYIFYLNEDETELTLHAWSNLVMEQCSVESTPTVFKLDECGIWGDAVRQRKPVITNDYDQCPHKKGYPEGHIRVSNHMNAPIFKGDRIMFLAGVGNKNNDYTEDDIRQLKLVMDGTMNILHKRQAILALEKAHEELEEKVQDRTAMLQTANEDFARLTNKLIQQGKEQERAQKALIRYERIISSSPDLITLLDRDYRFVMVNDAFVAAFGAQREALIGEKAHTLLGTSLNNDDIEKDLDRAFTGETSKTETWVDLPAQGKRFMGITYYPVSIEEDTIEFVSIEARDMTDLKAKEEALQETADRLDMATDAGNIGIWEWDLQKDETHWDHKMYELYKVQPGEFDSIYEAWRTRLHEDDLAEVERELADCIEENKRFDSEFRIVWPDGSLRFIKAAGTLRRTDDGMPIAMTGVNWDVTDRRTMEIKLRRLASTDPLTGASNRRYFMARLQAEFERCKRYQTPMVLLSIDIDHFKVINDTHGHPAGDEVLKDLVRKCLATLRTTDVFGRVGGEEFLAALTQTSTLAGQRTAERLRLIIENSPVEVPDASISYTISIGMTSLLTEDASIETLLKRADEALYKAKNNGRNRVEEV